MVAVELDQRKPGLAIRIGLPILLVIFCATLVHFGLWVGTAFVYNPVGLEFRFESATVSQLSHNGSPELTSTWNLTLVSTNPSRKLDMYLTGLEVSLLSWGQLGGYHFKLAATKQLPPPRDVIKMKKKNRVGVNIGFGSDELGKLILNGSARLALNVSAAYNYYKPMALVKFFYGGKAESWDGFCYPLRFGAGKGDQPMSCRGGTLTLDRY